MNLRDAIDDIEHLIEDEEVLEVPHYESLREVLEAAWKYWDLSEEDNE